MYTRSPVISLSAKKASLNEALHFFCAYIPRFIDVLDAGLASTKIRANRYLFDILLGSLLIRRCCGLQFDRERDLLIFIYYIPINDTPFELHVFWASDIEGRIKLRFSESVSLSLKMMLMTLLNMPQATSNVPA